MKFYSTKYSTALVFGAAMILAIFITRPAFSQEPAKKEGKKIVKINVITEDNGKTTVTDTTIEMPDSAMIDSIQDEIEKVIVIGNGGKHARFRYHNAPHAFNYNFEVPAMPPDCRMELEQLENLDEMGWEGVENFPGCRVMRMDKGQGQSLNDILGNIPMERVKSYSIKDTKKGKRIVIELDNAPIFEKEEKIIVIREPGRRSHHENYPGRRIKIIKHIDDGTKTQVPPEPQSPPPPPPPPDSKSGKTQPKAPKI